MTKKFRICYNRFTWEFVGVTDHHQDGYREIALESFINFKKFDIDKSAYAITRAYPQLHIQDVIAFLRIVEAFHKEGREYCWTFIDDETLNFYHAPQCTDIEKVYLTYTPKLKRIYKESPEKLKDLILQNISENRSFDYEKLLASL